MKVTRRAALLGAALVPFACKSDDEEGPTRATAIVIGTGFGGSIAAFRLAEKGIDTIVLERGRRWTVTDAGDTFPTWEEPDRRASWLADRPLFPYAPGATFEPYTGLIDRVSGGEIDVIMGAGVGGSSLVYGATMLMPSPSVFARVFPREVSFGDLERTYYPRVRDRIGLAPIPDDVLSHPAYESSRLFLEAARKTSLAVELNPAAVSWDRVRDEIAGRATPSLVRGQLVYGVNSGAKSSLDRNYLDRAEKTGKAVVRPLHVVKNIAVEADGSYRVDCDVIDERGDVQVRRSFAAKYVFLGAGSIGTSRLLVKARETRSLPALSPEVGRGWSNNGDLLVARVINRPTRAILGAPPAVVVRHDDNPKGPITIEHGTGASGVECECQPILGMGIPAANGVFTYDAQDDEVRLRWSKSDMGAIADAVRDTVGIVNAAGGGTLLDITQLAGLHTYHPLGGAVMGKACDFFGRVNGHRNLYVVDGALVPGSTACVNPAFTVAALAERCLDDILAKDFP